MLFATAARHEACLLGKDWEKLDMLTYASCGQIQERRLKVLSVPTNENLSDTFTKSLSHADADRCDRCMKFHMGHVGSGPKAIEHVKSKNTECITNLNELRTISDVSGNSAA